MVKQTAPHLVHRDLGTGVCKHGYMFVGWVLQASEQLQLLWGELKGQNYRTSKRYRDSQYSYYTLIFIFKLVFVFVSGPHLAALRGYS